MKRLIAILITGIIVLPSYSQLNGDGFYRFKNRGSHQRYLTISNNKVDKVNKDKLSDGKEGNVFGLKTLTDPISDPSSILYVSKEGTSEYEYIFEAQGINPLNFLKDNGATLKIYPKNGAYWIYATKGGVTRYMADNDGSDGYIKVVGSGERDKEHSYWYLEPVNQTENYLGIKPESTIKVGDKYYTTFYAGFPIKLSEGMKAYYVGRSNTSKIAADQIAEIIEIKDIIPTATPVILECSSLNPADNKVTPLPLKDSPTAISDNHLVGVYFCFAKMKAMSNEENTNSAFLEIRNVVNYDPSTMRVLGEVNGKLALVVAKDEQLVITDQGRYLPANKAYFTIDKADAEATANGIKLVDTATYIAGIDNIKVDEKAKKPGVYTLTGNKVKSDNSTEGLAKGVYIVNGKKVIKD
jgi:hypothetical protein